VELHHLLIPAQLFFLEPARPFNNSRQPPSQSSFESHNDHAEKGTVPCSKDSIYVDCDGLLSIVEYAFTNIPCDRPILQFLVDDFCDHWDKEADDELEVGAQKQFPTAFTLRVMRRFSEKLDLSTQIWVEAKRCFLEHASEEEKEACSAAHMKYNKVLHFGCFI
jgi:hypothetical protein